jgi:hypothetical protein
MKELKFTRRVTTPFLQAIPPQIIHFDAFLYAVVKRRPEKVLSNEKWGTDVRLDPCILDWTRKTITITIPLNINTGIETITDLDPTFYEAVEAAFLALMQGCLP